MATTYTQLGSGSRGDEVKKLQQSLVNAGYNIGPTGVDGNYGPATTAAVKKYQQDKGLKADGIAGNETLSSLYSTGKTTPQASPTSTNKTAPAAAPDYSKYQYDATSNDAYMQALATLQTAQKEVPTYAGTYDTQIHDLYNQIVNRDKFKYNLNEDMLYQQYADQYAMRGQLASRDAMGQAAALTGGYGNTYAQAVGQQAYDAYLQQLNDVVPELYGMALDQYNMEGDRMMQQYGMLTDMSDKEYGRYQDSLDRYWQNIDFLKGQTDDAYNRGYENWYNAYQMGMQADQTAYQRDQDAYGRQTQQYDRLAELITATGYTPTSSELTAAGMTDAQAQAYKNYYNQQNPTQSTSVTKNPSKLTTEKPAENPEQEVIDNFNGKTYSEAVAYLKKNGVDAGTAAGIMSQSEWSRNKSTIMRSETESNSGKPSVFDDKTSEEYLMYGRGYEAYLKDMVAYLITNA